jgi:two-component system KDP operon response regulator KdpE
MSNRATILVIDDEAQIRKLLEITLQSNDYIVAQAVTAKEGLMRASAHPPDVILLDLGCLMKMAILC